MAVDGAVSDDQNDICLTPLQQNFMVPWIDELDPNRESLFLRGQIGAQACSSSMDEISTTVTRVTDTVYG